jgi:hypothetical protein
MGLLGLKVIYLLFFFFLLFFRIWRPEYLCIYLLGDVGQDIYFQLYPGSDYGEIVICKTNCPPLRPEIYVHSLSMLDFSPTPK